MAVNVNDSENSVKKTQTTGNNTQGEGVYTIIASFAGELGSQYLNAKALTFDSVTTTDVHMNADLTSYPVESGVYISDHIQIKNKEFSIDGVITNTPMRKYRDLLYSTPVENRVKMAINYLTLIHENRLPLTFVTEHLAFENVVLKNINYSYQTEDALVFQLDFEQVRIAEKKAVRVDITQKKTASNQATGGTKKKQAVIKTDSDLNKRIEEQNKRGGVTANPPQ